MASRVDASGSPSRALVAAELRSVLAAMEEKPAKKAAPLKNKNASLSPELQEDLMSAFIRWSEYGSPPENPAHVQQFMSSVGAFLLNWERSISRHPDT